MRAPRVALALAALVLLAFGAASVHYTLEEDLEHHREWAAEHDMPPPAPWITVLGWAAVGAGGLLACLAATHRVRSA